MGRRFAGGFHGGGGGRFASAGRGNRAACRYRRGLCRRRDTAPGVQGIEATIGPVRQNVAGKGVHVGNGLEKVGFLTQPWVIVVRYTGDRKSTRLNSSH